MSSFFKSLCEKGKKMFDIVLDTELPIGIKLDDEHQAQENAKCKEIAEMTIAAAETSGYFKPDILPVIAEKIRALSVPGYAYSGPFDKEDVLSLEEKKALGLNTRRKYSRELINGLTEKGIAAENPNDLLKNLFMQSCGKVSRKYELARLKELGLKYVQIIDCEDARDCKAVKRCKKRWLIDEVPELPLSGCDAEYCRCQYVADEKEMLGDL